MEQVNGQQFVPPEPDGVPWQAKFKRRGRRMSVPAPASGSPRLVRITPALMAMRRARGMSELYPGEYADVSGAVLVLLEVASTMDAGPIALTDERGQRLSPTFENGVLIGYDSVDSVVPGT